MQVRVRRGILVGFVIAVVAVVGVTLYLHRGPGWVGTSQRVTVTKRSCDNATLNLHGRIWDAALPQSWSDGSSQTGRIHFDTAHRATFRSDGGTVLRFDGGYVQFDTMDCSVAVTK